MDWLDIHTHRPEAEAGVVSVYNQLITEPEQSGRGHRWRSVGIHPWYLEPPRLAEQLAWVERSAQRPEVIAGGECGLDRLRGPALAEQVTAFQAQARLAEEVGKPLIVHVVRAFDELLQLHRQTKPSQPWLLHGMNVRFERIRPLVEAGCYVSLGAALLRADSAASRLITQLPPERFLLETDDQPLAIRTIYEAAAGHLCLSPEQVRKRVAQNADIFVFGKRNFTTLP